MGKKSRRSRSPPNGSGASHNSNEAKCTLLQAGTAARAAEARRAEIQAKRDADKARRAELQAQSHAISERLGLLAPDSAPIPSRAARTGEAKDDSSSASSNKSRSPPHVATGSGTALNGASWYVKGSTAFAVVVSFQQSIPLYHRNFYHVLCLPLRFLVQMKL